MIEVFIEITSLLVAILLFYFLGLRFKYREAILAFLFMQVFTWPFGYIVAELELISYPSRFFKDVSKSSFTFEYLVFPVVAGLYAAHYPKNSSKRKKSYLFYLHCFCYNICRSSPRKIYRYD